MEKTGGTTMKRTWILLIAFASLQSSVVWADGGDVDSDVEECSSTIVALLAAEASHRSDWNDIAVLTAIAINARDKDPITTYPAVEY